MISDVLFHSCGVITENRFQKMTPIQWKFQHLAFIKAKKREEQTYNLTGLVSVFLSFLCVPDAQKENARKMINEFLLNEKDVLSEEDKKALEILELSPESLSVEEYTDKTIFTDDSGVPMKSIKDFFGGTNMLKIYESEEDVNINDGTDRFSQK